MPLPKIELPLFQMFEQTLWPVKEKAFAGFFDVCGHIDGAPSAGVLALPASNAGIGVRQPGDEKVGVVPLPHLQAVDGADIDAISAALAGGGDYPGQDEMGFPDPIAIPHPFFLPAAALDLRVGIRSEERPIGSRKTRVIKALPADTHLYIRPRTVPREVWQRRPRGTCPS